MKNQDIRWLQRFASYLRALGQLEKFILKPDLNELEKLGLIKAFEYTYELAWNTIKDFYENQGEAGIQGSRDAIQLAFRRGLIRDGAEWMQMLIDRNRTSHTYNQDTADEIAGNILNKYFALFTLLKSEFEILRDRQENTQDGNL